MGHTQDWATPTTPTTPTTSDNSVPYRWCGLGQVSDGPCFRMTPVFGCLSQGCRITGVVEVFGEEYRESSDLSPFLRDRNAGSAQIAEDMMLSRGHYPLVGPL